MLKIKKIIYLFIVIYCCFLLYFSIFFNDAINDMKLADGSSAIILAKKIGQISKCNISTYIDNVNIKKNKIYTFHCTKHSHNYFSIHIFKNENEKNNFLSHNTYKGSFCFKKGKYYVICEISSEMHPIFNGSEYYDLFPGDAIRH